MRFLVASGMACAAGESLTTTETVVSERPRWVARVRRVTRSCFSDVFLPLKIKFPGNFQEIAEGVSHLTSALSKGKLSLPILSQASFRERKKLLDSHAKITVYSGR